jgi:uncharacterized protein with HEPN domain
MDDLFEQIAAIAEQGPERFYAADYIMGNAGIGALIRLGELAKALPMEYVRTYPDINYTGMKKARDKLAHLGDDVDWGMIWNAIACTVPDDATRHREAAAQ